MNKDLRFALILACVLSVCSLADYLIFDRSLGNLPQYGALIVLYFIAATASFILVELGYSIARKIGLIV